MSEKRYNVPLELAQTAHLDEARYQQMYRLSIADPERFWGEQAQLFVSWFQPWRRVLDWDYSRAHIRWFEGAKLNAAFNCL